MRYLSGKMTPLVAAFNGDLHSLETQLKPQSEEVQGIFVGPLNELIAGINFTSFRSWQIFIIICIIFQITRSFKEWTASVLSDAILHCPQFPSAPPFRQWKIFTTAAFHLGTYCLNCLWSSSFHFAKRKPRKKDTLERSSVNYYWGSIIIQI